MLQPLVAVKRLLCDKESEFLSLLENEEAVLRQANQYKISRVVKLIQDGYSSQHELCLILE